MLFWRFILNMETLPPGFKSDTIISKIYTDAIFSSLMTLLIYYLFRIEMSTCSIVGAESCQYVVVKI